MDILGYDSKLLVSFSNLFHVVVVGSFGLLDIRAEHGEARIHHAARKHGLTMDIGLQHFDIPLCTDKCSGTVELVPWPFLLPDVMATLQKSKCTCCAFFQVWFQ